MSDAPLFLRKHGARQPANHWAEGSFLDGRAIIECMIRDKHLIPGENSIYVQYFSTNIYSDLLMDGTFKFQNQIYTSPGNACLAMKQTMNPDLRSDSGWGSLIVANKGIKLRIARDEWAASVYIRINPRYWSRRAGEPEPTVVATFMTLGEVAIKVPKVAAPVHEIISSSGRTRKPRTISDVYSSPSQMELDQDYLDEEVVIKPTSNRSRGRPLKILRCTRCNDEVDMALVKRCSACEGPYHPHCINKDGQEGVKFDVNSAWFCEECFETQEETIRPFLDNLLTTLNNDHIPSQFNDRHILTLQVNALLGKLNTKNHQMEFLASSTGEVLVHLSKMDLPRSLASIQTQLEEQESSSSLKKMITDLDVLHQLSVGQAQIRNTISELKSRNATILEECNTALEGVYTERALEAKARDDTCKKTQELGTEMPILKAENSKQRLLLSCLQHQHQLTHNKIITEKFSPVYSSFLEKLTVHSQDLLQAIVKSKIVQLHKTMEEWEKSQRHFESMLQHIHTVGDCGGERPEFTDAIFTAVGEKRKAVTVPPFLLAKQRQFYVNSLEMNATKLRSAQEALRYFKAMANEQEFGYDVLASIDAALAMEVRSLE